MYTENTNLILLVLCLKLFGDVSHSQNETHAPYSVLCDLLPSALVTFSHLIHTRCPLPLLNQGQLLPTEAIVPVVPSEDSSTWLSAPRTVALCIKVTSLTLPLSLPSLSYPHGSYLSLCPPLAVVWHKEYI